MQELVGRKTQDLRWLCGATDSDVKASGALFVYAACGGPERLARLLRASDGMRMHAGYAREAARLDAEGSLEAWLCDQATPRRYRDVWLAYQARLAAPQSEDARLKDAMRVRIRETLDRAEITLSDAIKLSGVSCTCSYQFVEGKTGALSLKNVERLLDAARLLAGETANGGAAR